MVAGPHCRDASPVPDVHEPRYDTPRLVNNAARVPHLNSVHGVRLLPGRQRLGRDLLPLAALNSLSALGAEIVGRSYGGGMLKLEPKEADVLPVPAPAVVSSAAEQLHALRPQLATALRGGELIAAIDLVDRALLVEGLGLRRKEVRVLRAAREAMFARRASRG